MKSRDNPDFEPLPPLCYTKKSKPIDYISQTELAIVAHTTFTFRPIGPQSPATELVEERYGYVVDERQTKEFSIKPSLIAMTPWIRRRREGVYLG
jgi:hypothetical protein